jgi:hypothetical protein
MPLFSGLYIKTLIFIFPPEDKSTKFLRNVGNVLTLYSSATWKNAGLDSSIVLRASNLQLTKYIPVIIRPKLTSLLLKRSEVSVWW